MSFYIWEESLLWTAAILRFIPAAEGWPSIFFIQTHASTRWWKCLSIYNWYYNLAWLTWLSAYSSVIIWMVSYTGKAMHMLINIGCNEGYMHGLQTYLARLPDSLRMRHTRRKRGAVLREHNTDESDAIWNVKDHFVLLFGDFQCTMCRPLQIFDF